MSPTPTSSRVRNVPTRPSSSSQIYPLIHSLHGSITRTLDSALTWDQLNSPEVNYTVVRPLVGRYAYEVRKGDGKADGKTGKDSLKGSADGGKGVKQVSVIYALMVNRIRFATLAEFDLAFQSLNASRASLCELLSIKLLRTFAEDELELVRVLTRCYCPFEGAPEDVWRGLGDEREDVEREVGNALEMAILSQSKHFLATPLAQKVINLIYSGQIVYTSRSTRSIIMDNYQSKGRIERVEAGSGIARIGGTDGQSRGKRRLMDGQVDQPSRGQDDQSAGIYVYDPTSAGWLDHTRLRIPIYRTFIDFSSFLILTILFMWNLSHKTVHHVDLSEAMFVIFAAGFSLDEFASSNEHGWTIYLANAWNAFDVSFLVLFWIYAVMRVVGLVTRRAEVSQWAFDLLSNGAIVLLPRLVFFVIKDNVLIVSLKAMIREFVQFMCLATVCFSGIGFTLWTLGRATWTARQIGWLMLQIWFGSSYLGFSASSTFHPVFGPIILVLYAALSNTLLVTILISILSNRFAAINSNAKEEHLFQKAVNTIEGVKADAIFSYAPPLNILALVILGPLSLILSAHNLHRVNVFAIRLANFPVLLGISCYERWRHQRVARRIKLEQRGGPVASRPKMSGSFMGSGSEAIIGAVFENSPADSAFLFGDPLLGDNYEEASEEGTRDVDSRSTEPVPSTTPTISAKFADLDRSRTQSRSKAAPHSPLSKVFSRRHTSVGGPMVGASPSAEVDGLKAEIRGLKEGQARMEEMMICLTKGLLKPGEGL